MLIPPFSDHAWFLAANMISIGEGIVLTLISNNPVSVWCGVAAIMLGAACAGYNLPRVLGL